MGLTQAKQIFLVGNGHMALGSTNAGFFLASLLGGDGPGAASKGRGECAVVQVTAESMQCTGRSLQSSPHDML